MMQDLHQELISAELETWCAAEGRKIRLSSAVAYHQEQNGPCESVWRHLRWIVFKILTHARVYATQIRAVLPLSSTTEELADGTVRPSTGYAIYYGVPVVSVQRFKVFGCPVIMKVRRRTALPNSAASASILDDRTIAASLSDSPSTKQAI